MIRLLLALALLATPARAARVVSLNLCADDYLVTLAPEQVMALTPLARDPSLSVVAEAARGLPWVRPDAEAVLRLKPDLVLAAPFAARSTVALLRRLGVRVEMIGLPEEFDSIRRETRSLASLLGVPARGEALLGAMDQVLAAPSPAPAVGRTRGRALVLEARGYTAGPGSLADSVLAAAGWTNAGSGRRLGLEAIVAAPPDLLVVSEPPAAPSLATDFVRHRVLDGIPRRVVPSALLICGGPWSAEAVRLLRE